MLICTNLNSVFYSMWTPFTVHQDSTISKGDPPKKIWLINSHIYKVCNNLSQIYHEIEALEKLTIQIHSTIVSSHSLGFPKLWSINMYKQHLSIIFLVCLLETPFFWSPRVFFLHIPSLSMLSHRFQLYSHNIHIYIQLDGYTHVSNHSWPSFIQLTISSGDLVLSIN